MDYRRGPQSAITQAADYLSPRTAPPSFITSRVGRPARYPFQGVPVRRS